MNVNLNVRIDSNLKKSFETMLQKKNLTVSDQLRIWITQYVEHVQEDSDFAPEQMLEGTVSHFLHTHNLDRHIFELDHTPGQYLREDFDFSFLFSEQLLREYIKCDLSGEVNDESWYIMNWMWTFLWSWLTVCWLEVPVPTAVLIERWKNNHDPVDTVAALMTIDSYTPKLKLLLKKYYSDSDRVKNW